MSEMSEMPKPEHTTASKEPKALTSAQLEQHYHAGHLSAPAHRRLLVLLGFRPKANDWKEFIDQFMLFTGAALVLAGVIFFFAYNWADMGRFMKFGVLQGGILAAVVLAWNRGLDKLSGKVSLLVAAILIGPLLAVYGQVYQTGADPYELFVGWAALALGWVAISRFAALWIFWLLLLNVGLGLYCLQILGMRFRALTFFLILAGFNGLCLLVWTFFAHRGVTWLQTKHRWAERTLFSATLFFISWATWMAAIFKSRYLRATDLSISLTVICYIGVLIGTYVVYRHLKPDSYPLSMAIISIIVIDTSFIGAQIKNPIYTFFLLSILVIAQATAGVIWLLKLNLDAPPTPTPNQST